MPKISVVINTLNEERNIEKALISAKRVSEDIVVVDMHSQDETVEICKKHGAKVYLHERTGYVEPARNYAISKAKGDWIFIIDADEEVPMSLAVELKKLAKEGSANYYRIPRRNINFNKWVKYSRWWPDYNIRFFQKGSVSWSEVIHSVPLTIGKGADLPASMEFAIVHHNYQTIEQYVDRMNRYTTVQAMNLVKEGYIFNWNDLIRKPIGEFMSRYFAGEGYRDGMHGLALASLQATSETVLYLKVWQLGKFKKQTISVPKVVSVIKDVQRDIYYWEADALLRNGGGIGQRIKRKFKLP